MSKMQSNWDYLDFLKAYYDSLVSVIEYIKKCKTDAEKKRYTKNAYRLNYDKLHRCARDRFNRLDLISKELVRIEQEIKKFSKKGRKPGKFNKGTPDHIFGRTKSTVSFISTFKKNIPTFYNFVKMVLYHGQIIYIESNEHHIITGRCKRKKNIDGNMPNSIDCYVMSDGKENIQLVSRITGKIIPQKDWKNYLLMYNKDGKYYVNKKLVGKDHSITQLLKDTKHFCKDHDIK